MDLNRGAMTAASSVWINAVLLRWVIEYHTQIPKN